MADIKIWIDIVWECWFDCKIQTQQTWREWFIKRHGCFQIHICRLTFPSDWLSVSLGLGKRRKNHNTNPLLWDLDPPWLYNKKTGYLRMFIILYWVSFNIHTLYFHKRLSLRLFLTIYSEWLTSKPTENN